VLVNVGEDAKEAVAQAGLGVLPESYEFKFPVAFVLPFVASEYVLPLLVYNAISATPVVP
jgi:hypothetical protein